MDLLVCDLLFERLFRRARNLDLLVNEHLVASLEEPDDPRIKIVHLRPNLRWHDGSPLTAEDMVFSWRQTVSAAVGAGRREEAERMAEVTEVDPSTARIVLREPHPTWRISMSFELVPRQVYGAQIDADPSLRTAPYYAALHRAPIGCGPFAFSAWKADRIVVKRWPLYGGRAPNADRIVLDWSGGPDGRLDPFLRGGLDLCPMDEDDYSTTSFTAEFRERGESARFPDTSYYYLFRNCRPDHPLFAAARVRRAMAHALNVERIKAQATRNLAAACYGPWPVESPYFNPQVRRLRFDLSRAAQLLDQAGWRLREDGLRHREQAGVDRAAEAPAMSFSLMTVDESELSRAIAEVFRADLARLGIDLVIDAVDWETQFLARRARGEFDALMGRVTPGIDPHVDRVYFVTGGKPNFGGYSNVEVDRLFGLAGREMEPSIRARHYQDIHRVIFEDQPMAFLLHPPSLWAISRRLRGVEFSPRGPFLFYPGVHDWWVPHEFGATGDEGF